VLLRWHFILWEAKEMKIALLLLSFVVLVIAQNPPPKPIWPGEFHTDFRFHSPDNSTTNNGSWTFSEKFNSEKFDHLFDEDEDEISRLLRFDLKQQFHILTAKGKQPVCTSAALPGALVVPNFSEFTFTAVIVRDGRRIDEWQFTDEDGYTTFYYDYEDTQEPVQLRDRLGIFDFLNFHTGVTEADFAIPSACSADLSNGIRI